MKHKAGGKITKSHSSAIPLALYLVNFLHKNSHVRKISLGPISVTPGSRSQKSSKIKFIEESSSIRAEVTDGSSHQRIRFYISQVASDKRKTFWYEVEQWCSSEKMPFNYTQAT